MKDGRKKTRKVKHTKQRRKTLEIGRLRRMRALNVKRQKDMLIQVPVDLRAMFKAWCGRRGYTMAGRIRQFMYDCVTEKIKE